MVLDRVDILLSTYNGEKYIKDQLDSIFDQSYNNIRVIVRDDGSKDRTLEIVKAYDVEILESSENVGAKMSFAMLLEYALNSSNSRYFMFADQDDVWNRDKVQKSIVKIQEVESLQEKPQGILVHSDLQVVDQNLRVVDHSFWHYSRIDPYKNALSRLIIQNTVTGCTMLINRELANLALPIAHKAIMHDWWIALVAAQFGKIVVLEEPTLAYRQHSSNDIGAKAFNLRYMVQKFIATDSIKAYQAQAQSFLEHYRNRIDHKTQEMLKAFEQLDRLSYLQRMRVMLHFNLLKQGVIRNIGLMLKV